MVWACRRSHGQVVSGEALPLLSQVEQIWSATLYNISAGGAALIKLASYETTNWGAVLRGPLASDWGKASLSCGAIELR